MNAFENLTPPNMDVVCTTQFVGNYSLTTPLQLLNSTTTQTCSDPWNYYKGYGFDIVIIGLIIAIIIKIVTPK